MTSKTPKARTLVIAASDRLNNSTKGNPRYRVTFTDGTMAKSSSNASWCYSFGNPGFRVGDTVTVDFTPAGLISHMSKSEEKK